MHNLPHQWSKEMGGTGILAPGVGRRHRQLPTSESVSADVSNAAFQGDALVWKALTAIARAQVLSLSPFYKWRGEVRPQQGEVTFSRSHSSWSGVEQENRSPEEAGLKTRRPCFCIAGDQTEGAAEEWEPRTKWLFMAPIPFKRRLFN